MRRSHRGLPSISRLALVEAAIQLGLRTMRAPSLSRRWQAETLRVRLPEWAARVAHRTPRTSMAAQAVMVAVVAVVAVVLRADQPEQERPAARQSAVAPGVVVAVRTAAARRLVHQAAARRVARAARARVAAVAALRTAATPRPGLAVAVVAAITSLPVRLAATEQS